jgi:exodeoxyribonuclease VIII
MQKLFLKGKTMQSIMLDLETLSTSPDSVILTCGAVKFFEYDEIEPNLPFYLKLNIDEQTNLGRIIDPGTLEWWGKQSSESQREAFSEEDRISLEEFTTQLNRYVVGIDKIWSQGTVFDIVILENLYRMLNKPLPWAYWQIRDSRTLFDLGDDSIKKGNASAHNALADSYFQAKSVQTIYKNLGIKKKE